MCADPLVPKLGFAMARVYHCQGKKSLFLGWQFPHHVWQTVGAQEMLLVVATLPD